jgi:hypothetical protein
MPLLGSNINSELFMSNPISNTSVKNSTEPVYIIKGDKQKTINFKDDNKNLSVNLDEFRHSLDKLSSFHNTLIQQLPEQYAKIFSDVIQALYLAKNSPPVHSRLLEITYNTFPQNLKYGIGCVASYLTKPDNDDYHPDTVASVFRTKNLNYRSLMLDSKTRVLYSITDNESNSELAHIYISKNNNVDFTDLIKQLKYNGIKTIILFSDYDNITKTFGNISNQINLEEYEKSFNQSKHSKNTTSSNNISSNSNSKNIIDSSNNISSNSNISSNISSKSSNNNNTSSNSNNNTSGLVFFIILLIIIVLALAIIYRNNY